MKLAIHAIALLASLPSAALAQSLAPDTQQAVDTVFSAFRPATPGCALGIYRDGRIAYARGYGLANLEHGIPITARTVFDIGSTSKQFTAASILLLVEDGKLSLDDPLLKWIPELPAYTQSMTVRHLLHHTSGIRDYLTLMSLRGIDFDGITTDRDALELIARQKESNFAPGSEHLYSNSGYFLLGEIVKRASGKSLPAFAQERIFGPLGMRSTHFHDDHTMVVPMRATGYAPRSGGYAISMSGFEQTGDGAVMTTVEDLLLWDRNFYDARVGGAVLEREFHVRGVLTRGDTIAYARGLSLGEYRGLRTVRHGGAWAGYRADLLRFPEERTSFAVLCNLGNANPSRLAERVADIVLASRLQPPRPAAATPPRPQSTAPNATSQLPANLAALVGTYYSAELDVSYTFRLRDGRLVLVRPGRPELPLEPAGATTFRAAGVTFEFQREGGAPAARVIAAAGRVRNLSFVRREP